LIDREVDQYILNSKIKRFKKNSKCLKSSLKSKNTKRKRSIFGSTDDLSKAKENLINPKKFKQHNKRESIQNDLYDFNMRNSNANSSTYFNFNSINSNNNEMPSNLFKRQKKDIKKNSILNKQTLLSYDFAQQNISHLQSNPKVVENQIYNNNTSFVNPNYLDDNVALDLSCHQRHTSNPQNDNSV